MSGILGYAVEHERREAIYSRGLVSYARWRSDFDQYTWEPPAEMDPEEWFEVNDQGRIGSCAAQALTDTAEYCHVMQHGEPIQLSRGFAYLETQKHDGLLGRDAGSTLDGGTRVLHDGLPLESEFPYVDDYRALYNRYRSNTSLNRVYKLDGEIPLQTAEDAYRFLSSWQGIIQIGIAWTISDGGYEITSYQYNPRAGGHSVGIVGYVPMPAWQPLGIGFKLKNSWSRRWGRNGYKLLHPKVYDQMFRPQWNIAIGRSDMPRPKPRIEAIDHAKHLGIAS